MIKLTVRRVRPGFEGPLQDWFAALQGPRREEAVATLRAEGIHHELALLLPGRDHVMLVYALQSDDLERARAVADASAERVDTDHRRVLREALLPFDAADQGLALDLQV